MISIKFKHFLLALSRRTKQLIAAFTDLLSVILAVTLAKQLGETSLVFLVHPTLSSGDMTAMNNIIKKVLKGASI